MSRGVPLPGSRQGVFSTLIHKVFRLRELDKEIERSQDTFAALDRSLDKLPPGSTIVIRDQDTQIAVWKAGQEAPDTVVTAEVVAMRISAIDVTGNPALPGPPCLDGCSSEAG
jgi:hypothetical protein